MESLNKKRKLSSPRIDYYQFQSRTLQRDVNGSTKTEINVQMPRPIGKNYTHFACRKLIFSRPMHWDFCIEAKKVEVGSRKYQYEVIPRGFVFTDNDVRWSDDFDGIKIEDYNDIYKAFDDQTLIDVNIYGEIGYLPWYIYKGIKSIDVIPSIGSGRTLLISTKPDKVLSFDEVRVVLDEYEIGTFVPTPGSKDNSGVVFMNREDFVKIFLTRLATKLTKNSSQEYKNICVNSARPVKDILQMVAWTPKPYITIGDGPTPTDLTPNVSLRFPTMGVEQFTSVDRQSQDGLISSGYVPQPTIVLLDSQMASILGWNAFRGPVNMAKISDGERTVEVNLSENNDINYHILTSPSDVDKGLEYPSYRSPFDQILIISPDLNINAKTIPFSISENYTGFCPVIASFTPAPTSSRSFFTDKMLVSYESFQVGEVISCEIPEGLTTFKFYIKYKDPLGYIRDLSTVSGETITIELAFWEE